jgi:hypothetical protein
MIISNIFANLCDLKILYRGPPVGGIIDSADPLWAMSMTPLTGGGRRQ